MLGLILLYFIGKEFYKLAEEAGKRKWLYAILGIVAYCGVYFIGGILLVVIFELTGFINVEETSDFLMGLMPLPLGLLGCWLFYKYLKKSWKDINLGVTDAELSDFGTPEAEINSETELNK